MLEGEDKKYEQPKTLLDAALEQDKKNKQAPSVEISDTPAQRLAAELERRQNRTG